MDTCRHSRDPPRDHVPLVERRSTSETSVPKAKSIGHRSLQGPSGQGRLPVKDKIHKGILFS